MACGRSRFCNEAPRDYGSPPAPVEHSPMANVGTASRAPKASLSEVCLSAGQYICPFGVLACHVQATFRRSLRSVPCVESFAPLPTPAGFASTYDVAKHSVMCPHQSFVLVNPVTALRFLHGRGVWHIIGSAYRRQMGASVVTPRGRCRSHGASVRCRPREVDLSSHDFDGK